MRELTVNLLVNVLIRRCRWQVQMYCRRCDKAIATYVRKGTNWGARGGKIYRGFVIKIWTCNQGIREENHFFDQKLQFSYPSQCASGSNRPKPMRIRIRNTVWKAVTPSELLKWIMERSEVRKEVVNYGRNWEMEWFLTSGQLVWNVENPRRQCCGSGIFIPDPGSWFLPIPDLGSRIPDPKTAIKERDEKKLVVIPFFVAKNFTKLKIILFLEC